MGTPHLNPVTDNVGTGAGSRNQFRKFKFLVHLEGHESPYRFKSSNKTSFAQSLVRFLRRFTKCYQTDGFHTLEDGDSERYAYVHIKTPEISSIQKIDGSPFELCDFLTLLEAESLQQFYSDFGLDFCIPGYCPYY